MKGYIENLIEVSDYILGKSKMPFIRYEVDKDWSEHDIEFEPQKRRLETSNCTAFAITSQIERFMRKVYGERVNYSDRFVGIMAGTRADKGNNPRTVYEAIREYGLIPEDMLPYVDGKDYYTFNGADEKACLAEGKRWLETHDLRYEALWDTIPPIAERVQRMQQGIQTSPLAISVTAWREENGEYVSDSGGNNHLTQAMAYENNFIVDDSYVPRYKTLSRDHNIRRAYRIYVGRYAKKPMQFHVRVLEALLTFFMTQKKITQVAERYIGKDPTPNGVSNEVACAEVVTTILREAGIKIPLITGTWTLNEFLKKSSLFEVTDEPEEASIVISPTGMGKPMTNGHVGIYMPDGTIASNTSFGVNAGKFLKNHTLPQWKKYYGGLGYPTIIYRLK